MLVLPLFFSLTLVTAAVLQPEPQEATLEEAMAACLGIPDRSSRLECFESLAKAVEKVEELEQSGTGPEQTLAAPELAPQPARKATIAPKAPVAGQESDAPTQTTAEAEKKFLIIPKSDPRAKTARPSPFTAEILKAWLRYDKIYLALDNGEIWKQTSRNRPRMPKDGQAVEFTKGVLGGWLAEFENSSGKYSFALVE